MATTDTQLQQLVINVGTDAQIQAGIASGTITEDMLSIATDGADISYDWIGTLAEYNAQDIKTQHPDWLCFITDDVNNAGEDVYDNVYSKTQADETFVAKTAIPGLPCLLEVKWSDHILNNVSWLRADTFSWQSGEMYGAVYEHLLSDIEGKALQSETIEGITISYYLADDEHKICSVSEESKIASLYDKIGITWYFILDTENYRFKLPHKHSSQLVRSVKNADNTWYRLYADGWVEQGGLIPLTTTGWKDNHVITLPIIMINNKYNVNFMNGYTDYVDHNTVVTTRTTTDFTIRRYVSYQSEACWEVKGYSAINMSSFQADEKYLYFYVGEFAQDAIENTAGVTIEVLNTKADVDLQNTPMATADYVVEWQNPTADNNYRWYRKYKSGWIEQGGYTAVGDDARVTVTLTKPMADTYYTVTFGNRSSTYTASTFALPTCLSKTTTTFDIGGQSNGGNCNNDWEVKGMAAA